MISVQISSDEFGCKFRFDVAADNSKRSRKKETKGNRLGLVHAPGQWSPSSKGSACPKFLEWQLPHVNRRLPLVRRCSVLAASSPIRRQTDHCLTGLDPGFQRSNLYVLHNSDISISMHAVKKSTSLGIRFLLPKHGSCHDPAYVPSTVISMFYRMLMN